MRDYIVEQMNKGVSLEDIHIAVEQMFNDEYNKREEQKRKEMEIYLVGVALDRAAEATAEYFNAVTGSTEFHAEEFKEMLQDLAPKSHMVAKARARMNEPTKAARTADALAAARGVMNPRVEVIHNGVEDKEAEEKLIKFLTDAGLIPV